MSLFKQSAAHATDNAARLRDVPFIDRDLVLTRDSRTQPARWARLMVMPPTCHVRTCNCPLCFPNIPNRVADKQTLQQQSDPITGTGVMIR